MSRPGPDRQDLPGEGSGRRNPFGAPSPSSEPHHTATMADAVRRSRWIAVDINAALAGLFFITPSADRSRLVPCFDSEHPGISPRTKQFVGHFGDAFARHANHSTIACWWSSEPESTSSVSFATLQFVDRSLPGPNDTSGIAFPVYAEGGQSGLVVFTGPDITLDDQALFDTHGRCFALFAAVTRLRPMEVKAPSISKRELECLKLTANGHTSDQIAGLLGLSVHTANQYLTNITQKLNAVNRMHAVAKAMRIGLIE